jgi:NDP-sugar pyrophosphorylase family protein
MEILLLPHKNELMETITSIILCAGEGIRAKDIVDNTPKPLVKVKSLNNQSILSLIISNLVKLKLDQIIVVTGHLGEKIADFVNSSRMKDQFSLTNILIHSSGVRYKLGPLYSFLSITTNNQIFKNDKIYMVFPGDTVFDYTLLKEILDLLLENYSQVIHNSIIFYRKIRADTLMKKVEKYSPNYEKSISCLKIEEKHSKSIVKKISQEKLSSISNEEVINQVIPIFTFSNEYVKNIRTLANPVRFRTIREVVNLMIEKKKQFYAVSVSSESNFYDIDTPLDLKILNEKKKDGQ